MLLFYFSLWAFFLFSSTLSYSFLCHFFSYGSSKYLSLVSSKQLRNIFFDIAFLFLSGSRLSSTVLTKNRDATHVPTTFSVCSSVCPGVLFCFNCFSTLSFSLCSTKGFYRSHRKPPGKWPNPAA